jgi:hypothetical protein
MSLKTVLIIVGCIVLAIIGYYLLGEIGTLAGVAALFGPKIVKLNKQVEEANQQATEIKKEIQEIEKKEIKLKSEGVENKSTQEEVDYWKNQ